MTALTHDDTNNIRQCLDGNANAFEPLVRRYQNAAFAVAMSFLRDRSDAEDVVQDAFVAAYCKLPQLKDPAIFGSWLHRIVVNHCKDWRRRKSVDRLIRVGSESESVRGAYLLADQVHQNYIECLELWDEVEKLPEHYRHVVTLYYYTGFSLKEIAAFLDIRESTVRGRLYQSRIRLREALSPKEKETIAMSQIDVTEEVRDVVCKIATEGFEETIDMGDKVNVDGLDGSLMAYSCSSCRINEITGDVFLFNSMFSEIGSVGGSLYQRMYGYGGNEGCSLDDDMLRRNPFQNDGKIKAVKGDVDIDVGCMDLNALGLEGDIAIYNRYGKTRLCQSSRNNGHRCYVRSVSGDVNLVLDRKRAENIRLVMHTICGVAKYGELKKLMPISSWAHNDYWMSLATTDDFANPDITVLTESGTVDIEITKNGKHS